jgi:hypothetical protein
VNVATTDGALTKSGGCDSCPDSGAHSAATLTGDGYAEFIPAAGHRMAAALSTDLSASTGGESMNYAFSIWPNGAFEVRERGVYRTEGWFAPGDRFRIAVENGSVVYRRNGIPVYVSAVAPTFPMAFDVTLSTLGASLSKATVATSPTMRWNDQVNATAWHGDLAKSGGCDLCPDSGAHSAAVLGGNGFVEFVPAAGQRLAAGLSSDLSASPDGRTIDYAISSWPNGAFEIRERGIYRAEGWFAAGDRFRISIDGSTVTYSRNGAPIYTSAAAPVFPMALDVTLSSAGASILESRIVSLPTTVIWADAINVAASAGALTKVGGCDGCPDAGAHSAMRLTGEGYAEFVAPAGHRTIAGLSADLTASTSGQTLNYGFSLWPNGAWEIRELGVYKRDGSFSDGDRFRVAIEGKVVVYRRNGFPVYTSATAPVFPLVFDVTLSSIGATLTGATMGTGPSELPSADSPATTQPPPTIELPPAPELPTGVVAMGPYTAVVDRLPHAKPPVPVLGPAGSSIIDPVFLSTIGRVTDSATRPGALNRSYRSPSSPHQNAWSAGGSYFYVVSSDGSVLPYAFDSSQGTAHRIQPTASGDGGLVLRFYVEPQFSYVSDSIIYGTMSGAGANYRSVDQYDFTTGAYTRLIDLETVVPDLAGTYVGGLASSAGPTERIMVLFGGQQADYHHYVLVFDKANPEKRYLIDTIGSTVNGQPTSLPLNFTLHHAAIDRSGRYVMLYTTYMSQGAPRKAAQEYLWDLETGVFTEMGASARPYGHDAFGYGTLVNQECCTATAYDAAQWQFRWLAAPLATRDVITHVLTPKQVYWADHTTWNNARPDRLMPFISGMFRGPTSDTPWRAWDDEIAAVQSDAAPGADAIVWRFAHHRTDVRNDQDATVGVFWYTPRPNVSQDGRWVIFTSNWEKTLGTDPSADPTSGARQDVFVVQLKGGSQ